MDELVYLNLLEEMEAAGENVGGQEENVAVIQQAQDISHLRNEQFGKQFRLSREAFNFLVDSIGPHLKQQVKNIDICPTLKILVALRFFLPLVVTRWILVPTICCIYLNLQYPVACQR